MENKTPSLAELFARVEEIHRLIVNHINHDINFLTLTATGAWRDNRWTATFATLSDLGDEWHEYNDMPLTAKASTPEEALQKAINLVEKALT